VRIGIREQANYVKFMLELNYKFSDYLFLFASAGTFNTTRHWEKIILDNNIKEISLDPNTNGLTFTTQVPVNQLFDFNGLTLSFGIQVRISD